MNAAEAVVALGALAHPLRLEIFRALVVVGGSGLSAGSIMGGVGVPAATLSFHLNELTEAGLVTRRRCGRHLVYRAAYDRMDALLGYLGANCCAGSACAGEPPPAAGRIAAVASRSISKPSIPSTSGVHR